MTAVDAERVMRDAIALTEGTNPHPNPRVAALIIDPDGRVVASGAHSRAGEAHAERVAIGGTSFPGHTMIVTLEPCAHTGRTPPCVEAIVDAGISHVVVGATDPDVRVSGRGIESLREAGINVDVGVLADEVEAADPGYFHHRRTGRARITLKIAATIDGQVAALDGTSQWITSPEARTDAHALRARHDAVVVGAGTVITDDPALTVRLDGWTGVQPRPVIVAGRRDIPDGARVAARDPIVYRSESGVDVGSMVGDLPKHGILDALVEGGPTLSRSLLGAEVVDELVWYVGAALAGGVGRPAIEGAFSTLADRHRISITDVTRLGPDVRITARIIRQEAEDSCSPES